MQVIDIKAFVPSKDYEQSQAFYTDIGFQSEHVSDDLTLLSNGECQLFLQRFYNAELADNFMLQICVSDIDQAYALCANTPYKTQISEISQESWGKVFFLWGPVGELLHITELHN